MTLKELLTAHTNPKFRRYIYIIKGTDMVLVGKVIFDPEQRPFKTYPLIP